MNSSIQPCTNLLSDHLSLAQATYFVMNRIQTTTPITPFVNAVLADLATIVNFSTTCGNCGHGAGNSSVWGFPEAKRASPLAVGAAEWAHSFGARNVGALSVLLSGEKMGDMVAHLLY
jgi:hypothetical protein